MIIFILWLFIIMFIILLIKQLNLQKNIVICILISIFIILFVLNIKQCMIAALDGCKLWYNSVLPVTFPFVVICNLLIYYDGIDTYSKILGPLICKPLGLSKSCSFPIVASMLCGYPLGAKYSVDIYSMGYIDKKEYERLLNIASNVGPLFLIGSISGTLLGNLSLGYILLFTSNISILFIGFITKRKGYSIKSNTLSNIKKENINLGNAIRASVENGINTTISIGGFIIIFSVVISLIKNSYWISGFFTAIENILNINQGTIYSIFLGTIEMTNGCNIASNLNVSLPVKISIISFLTSFSGFAVLAQISSFTSSTKINYKKYIFYKFIQGIFSFVLTYIVFKLLPSSMFTSTLIVSYNESSITSLYPIAILFSLTLILKFINKFINLFCHTA